MYRNLLIEKFKPDYINNVGSAYWLNRNGKIHRNNDLPAVITHTCGMEWFKNGKRHRDGDKPAIVFSDGAMFWFKNGKRHRDNDKPAYISSDGCFFWYRNGILIKYEDINVGI